MSAVSTIDGPLGATTSGATLDLKGSARAGSLRLSESVVGRLGLASVLVSALLLCLAAARTNALLPETIQPAVGVLGGPLSSFSFHLRSGEVLLALTLMFFGYMAAVRNAEHLSPRLMLSAIAVFVVLVLLAPPLFSTDVFSYQEYARMFFGLHANPYTSNSEVLALDPIHGYIGAKWINTPTVYGPLFTLLSGLFEKTSNTDAIAFSAYAYKTIAALSCAGVIYMVWRAAKLRGVNPVGGAVLIGLNPLVVLYGIGGGHNDLLMMLFATAGIWALIARRERASGALTIVAAAVKLTGGLFLPFALVANPGPGVGGRRRRLLFGAAVAAIVCVGVGIAIFGSGLTHMLNTLSTVQGEGGWSSVPGFFSAVLSWETASHIISVGFGAAFTVICVSLLWRVHTGRLDWIEGSGWATFFLLVATSSILPWYITWLLVPVALCTNRRLLTATLWFTGWIQLTTMMSYLPHAPHVFGL
jgi:alpha-1,6-mannosyltransferase